MFSAYESKAECSFLYSSPPTEWVIPDGYPNLSNAKTVAIDLETKDPHLTTMGSGWARKDGHVIGIAVAVEGDQWYFPYKA